MSRLVITDLVVESFRKFDRPFRLAGLGPGLNLLAAPNEAGKSTLKAALDAALFQRHRLSGAGAAQYLNQRHDAPPAVSVAFSLNGADYRLAKRFHRQQKAVLERPDGSSVEGDAAERELQTLLGFQAPERGGIRQELLGVWGLLWASQGDTIQPLAVSETARDSLAECLAAGGVAAVTGGRRGSAVPARVKEALAAHLTPGRGQATGRYKQLQDEKAALERALSEAETLQGDLAEQTRALLTTRRDLAAEERGTDDEAELAAIKALDARLTQARELAQQVENARLSLSLASQEVQSARDAASRRQELAETAARQAAALAEAAAANDRAAEALNAAGAARATAEEAKAAAEARAKAARARAEQIARQRALNDRHRSLQREAERLRQALEAGRESQRLRKVAEANPCTPDALKRLRRIAGEQAAAAAARRAAATTLRFRLSAEGVAALRLDGAAVDAEGAVDLLQPARLELGPLGSVEIAPRVQDADALERGLRDAQAALTDALQTLNVESLAEAETEAERLADLLAQAKSATERARTLVPDAASVTDLATRLQQAEGDLQDTAAALDTGDGPPDEPLADAEDAANSARIEADAALAAASERFNEARQAEALAAQAAQHATQQLCEARSQSDSVQQTLAAARATADDAALAERLAAAEQKQQAAEAALKTLEDKAETIGKPDRLAAQLDRAETARRNRQDRMTKLRLAIARLEEQVRAASAKGPDEAVAEAQESLARVGTELARIEREKDALQLLDQVLTEAAREAEARYLAPLTRHLRPYIADLLGEAELELNSRFGPEGLHRAGTQEDFAQLSEGTKEQLAILTRLAFADVLAAQDRPAVLLLDDALLYCDDVRLESMFTALERAAERFQVIVFTCHARAFDGLGGHAQRRLAIEPADAIAF